MAICSQPGCQKRTVSRGLCGKHYQARRKEGTLPEHWVREKSSLWKTNSQRLLEKIKKDDNGCWVWTAKINPQGYGQTAYWNNGKHRGVRAHRLAWETWRGEIPDGLFILHNCDNKACINPDHLRLGTHMDNMEDVRKRGNVKNRNAGPWNGRAKLSMKDAREIRRLYAMGRFTQEEIGQRFGVSQFAVSAIVRNKRYIE